MATKPKLSLNLVCPECGSSDEALTIDLNDLRTISCGGCSAEFTAFQAIAKLEAQVEAWRATAAWLDLAPIEK